MKLATNYPHLWNNFEYTELMDRKVNKKIKGLGLHLIMQEFLREYGVYIGYETCLEDKEGNQMPDEKVNAVSITIGEFPIENELILQQLYGWTNRNVHIMIGSENGAYGDFTYDLDDYSVVFQGKKFNTFAEFWSLIKVVPVEHTETYYNLSV